MDIVLNGDVAEPTTKTVTKVQRPKKYHVILLNDDFTPMDFVTRILKDVFFKTMQESIEIMLEVHHNGRGIAGTYTREIAETQSSTAMDIAAEHGHPLKCIIEVDDDDSESTD